MQARIILFEDNTELRQLLMELFEEQGYEVVSSADPSLCPLYAGPQSVCPHTHPCGDILLTDNQMPNLSGIDFIVLQHQRGCKGVIRNKAILSAALTEAEAQRAEELGCRVFLKPPDIAAILDWIDERVGTIPAGRQLEDLGKLIN